ncbi:hypothetical protein [Pseudomonas sp. Xaverov 259]|uniref:hypothetical protein n=1 Tax=Pseudomonas sp. Xaverov 259 TaxID=2666086 RepID=UPI001C5B3183|nr:hypothetical protein [Pseudomonas sp. Xaverov 259]
MSPYREMKLMAQASESNRLETQAKLDRVTAERDALQQRLTAADERNDLAIDLLRRARAVIEGGGWADLERDIAKFLKPADGSKPSTCTWTEGGFSWHTGCGKEWQFTDGGLPAENGMHFCHSCGKALVVESAQTA